ncbi:hypothetical protein GF420_00375 [candidate division GN15 bacterium]|nr:hypothetical protein [candidate division GN15 bacterium]
MAERKIFVVIGCDTDPDRAGFVPEAAGATTLIWRGMLEGIPRAKDRLSKLVDADGNPPLFTWCLRADKQVKMAHGSYAYVMEEHHEHLLDLERSGDELAWHPHFWQYDEARNIWYQEFRDIDWQLDMLEQAHAAFEQALPGRIKSARMGWIYHNDRTFQKLAELGVRTEFSALPGHRIDPGKQTGPNANFFDWSVTPNRPYYASIEDYRREPRDGEGRVGMLEAPVFVSESFFWGAFRGFVLARKMKAPGQIWLSLRFPTYWISITGKPVLFSPVLNQARKRLLKEGRVFFVTYFHPDELLDTGSAIYSLPNMEQNLSDLLALAEREDATLHYLRAGDLPGLIGPANR